ncbi:JmjC domain-containing protein [Streptomyces acidiscabies]|uniref:Cupin domain-containing protein n=1 Tax=Streptomyces acidiscabies TaxID=42234 RepID=A0AAP6BLT8_9ACTN|nr:cupin domain-containing protein [Streptomyces acidiscabies]MBP5935467.1 cupin [Streptomyces sp. LBUM 1476]MBZ3916670.1 cupin [Streptomyces acidiscabies]MDX2967169.1 cupin domain-containing protein [Streptomyces acidiscabies]MDX3025427.1 cupin domain-containing protein [Streptomyces acidiscabies]MDX3795985.1 cupin domain-containing protein [Streptomyces acidiscabies]
MEHQLISAIETALGWNGAEELGRGFVRGSMDDLGLVSRIMTPNRLLDIAMRRSLNRPQFRCFQKGEEVHPAIYYTDSVSPRGQSISMVNMRSLGRLLGEGATVIMDQANVFDPTMEVTCRALQWWSHERVQVNAYLTTNDAAGFPLHWDDHDVIIVQLAGEKEWEVRSTSRKVPMYRDADPNTAPSDQIIWSGVMRTGDVMHIPRGHWHQATRTGSGSGKSLHVTFGITKRTGASYLTWLADWCREQELFRHDLDRRHGTGDDALVTAAAELVSKRSPADYLAAYEQEATLPRHVPFLGILGPLDAVVCTTRFRPQIVENGDTVDVVASGKRLTLAAKALPALRLLTSGRPVDLEQAAAIVGTEVTEVAEILVKEELCAVLTPELSSGYTGLVTNAVS